ncbi:MAG: hypothetical protein WAS21_11550 [Geminicoccaceae bacterium]
MAISRKPKPTDQGAAVDIDALIHKGGSVAGQGKEPSKPKPVPVILRIPNQMLARLDAAVEARVVPTPRTTWILEAIAEKLERESH